MIVQMWLRLQCQARQGLREDGKMDGSVILGATPLM